MGPLQLRGPPGSCPAPSRWCPEGLHSATQQKQGQGDLRVGDQRAPVWREGHLCQGSRGLLPAPLPPTALSPLKANSDALCVCVCVCVCLSVCVCVGPAGSLPYEYKIVIAGNHELTFDQEFMADLIKQDFYYFPSVSKLKPENYENVQSLLTNCIYLQDSEVTVRGFRIYGSPW